MANRLNISIIKKKPQAGDESDLRLKLTREIAQQEYECMICYENIKCNAKVWSCKTCWAIFHMNCILKWGKSSGAESGWRCPGCQSNYPDFPSDYFCFCGKVIDPKSKLAPHSCQNTCGKIRDCSHPCIEVCHPGPCSPCGSMIRNTCFCGKESFMSKCSSGSQSKISCNAVCSKLLSCSKHECMEICHRGPCSPCSITFQKSCQCGKDIRFLACGNKSEFHCDQKCGFQFDCMIHTCNLDCHESTSHSVKCLSDPSILNTCPCRKTKLNRTKCTDIVSTCDMRCDKLLLCGHTCIASCHIGECPACSVLMEVKCRCEQETIRKVCSEVDHDENGLPLCSTPCSKKNHCKRHRCGRRCCIMDVHICERICQKPLSCKLHSCLQQCGHPDRCHTCVEGVSFEERVCSCGQTKMLPPIACNTPPIICNYPCNRPQPCGHSSLTPHNCHPDSEPCPPCMIFIPKPCHCGSLQIPAPCSRRSRSCGMPCKGRFIGCNHPCSRPCHEGSCNDGEICRNICGKLRNICGHICRFKCHGTLDCPQDKPCGALVLLNCPCGRIKIEKQCGSSLSNPQNILESMIINCDDDCVRSARNALLSLGIDTDHKQEGTDFDASLLTFALENLVWIKKIESKIKDFLKDSSKKHYYFPSRFNKTQNRILLDLAPYYNLFAEIVDEKIGKGTVIYRKHGDNFCEPKTLLSVASKSFDPNLPEIETEESDSNTTKKSGINGLYFTNLQLGLDSETLKTIISTFTSLEITLEHVTTPNKKDCAFVFNSNQGNLEKTLYKLKKALSNKLVEENLVKSIQVIQVEDGEIQFRKSSNPILLSSVKISSQNPFDLLKEKL